MIASRRNESPAAVCQMPWPSGPRRAIAPAMRASSPGSGGAPPTPGDAAHGARLAPQLVVERGELPADHVDVVLALGVGATAQAGVVAVLGTLDQSASTRSIVPGSARMMGRSAGRCGAAKRTSPITGLAMLIASIANTP